jgi:hypothetical protein
MIGHIVAFWNERKKTKLGQLHLLWIVSVVFCAVTAIKASDLSTHQKLAFGLGGSVLLYGGLILCYFIPSVYLGFIRERKAQQQPTIIHRVIFSLYIFPVIPLLFMVITAIIMSTGIFDQ